MAGRSSLKDVAKEAGVSVTTVSRHLNGSLELPESTRDRIDQAVQELDYQPNPHARRLSLGRSDTIALIIPDIANPFFSTLAASVEHAAAARGSMVILHATFNNDDREIAALELATRNHVDGIIFLTSHAPSERVAKFLNEARHAVVLDEDVPGAHVPRVFCDNESGGFLAGQHLAEMGHKRVAYICGGPELMSTSARLAGLKRGLARFNAEGDTHVSLLAGDYSAASGRALAERFLDQDDRGTALFVGSDELAIGVIETLIARNIHIPDELSIVSFDDVRPLHLFDPPITAVRQPVRALGQKAIDILFADPAKGTPSLDHPQYLPVTLSERASVAPPASATPTIHFQPPTETNNV